MIDIHTHILPGIDDGAQTEADSIEMAKVAVEQGIHTIIATPHHKNGSYDNARESILTYTEILNELFKSEDLPLTLLAGQETRINGEMIEGLENGEILPLNNTKYVFVEFSSTHIPRFSRQVLFDIQVAGYTPIIVHPERNQDLMEHPDRLYDFVRKGALTQITAGSLIGNFGKKVQKFTHQLIDANLTHFIASDAHNVSTRSFWMQEAFQIVRDTYNLDVYYMFLENSQLLVDGMNVNRMEPFKVRKKRFLGLF